MLLVKRLLSRRSAIGGMAGVGLASTAGLSARATEPSIDLSSPRDNLRALLKMLASTDPGEKVFHFAAGRVYACISARAPIPLFGTHSIGIARGALRPDGGFRLREHVVGFRTRFETEIVIEEMRNPVTGETVKLPLTDYGIYDTEYRADGTYALVKPEPRRLSAFGPKPWSEAGGIVALSDDAMQAESGPLQPKIDVISRFATARELADPGVTSAASWFSFSAVDPFRPWLKMPVPGLQLWHVHGRKVASPSQLPEYIRRVAAQRFPDLFDLPSF